MSSNPWLDRPWPSDMLRAFEAGRLALSFEAGRLGLPTGELEDLREIQTDSDRYLALVQQGHRIGWCHSVYGRFYSDAAMATILHERERGKVRFGTSFEHSDPPGRLFDLPEQTPQVPDIPAWASRDDVEAVAAAIAAADATLTTRTTTDHRRWLEARYALAAMDQIEERES